MSLFDKRCPSCQAPVSFRKYLRTFSPRFTCDECGAKFDGGGFWRVFVGAGVGSLFVSLPLIEARYNPELLWIVFPGVALSAIWGYMFFAPREITSK